MGVEPASMRASGCLSVHPGVNTCKHEYLPNQQADCNHILSDASLGREKGCIGFLARSDRNSGFLGNGWLP